MIHNINLALNKSHHCYIAIILLYKLVILLAIVIIIIYVLIYKKYIKITLLLREGVVRPCRIGEDGKPKPIEHVLELQNRLPKQQYRKNSDSE